MQSTFTAEPHPAACDTHNQLAEFIADNGASKDGKTYLRRYEFWHSAPQHLA